MEKICQTCGVKGFSKCLIYCTKCWDTVEHIYCLGLSPDDICEDFSWKCDFCPSIDELHAKVIQYGDKQDEEVRFAGCGPLGMLDFTAANVMPVVGPIWRGVFNTVGSLNGIWKGLQAYMPKTSYLKVVNIVRSMPPSIHFHMKKRCKVLPTNYDDLGAANYNIGLYIFPKISRNDDDYNKLLEYMKSNDLALTTKMANLELLVFTSFDISTPERHKIQGRYYLWGTFKEEEFRESPSKCYRPSAAKSGIGKGVKAVGRPEDKIASPSTSSINKSSAISKQWKTLKKIRKRGPLLRCEFMPPLRPECKRARSKRGKERKVISRKMISCNDQNSSMLHQTSDKQSLAETCPIVEALTLNNPCSKDDFLANHQYSVDEEVFHEINPPADGLTQLPPLEDKHETPLENVILATPVIDLEVDPETSINPSIPPIIIDLDAEESPKREAEDYKESSVMAMPTSILEMADNYHDVSSNVVGTQVGRYNISSDLAPTLTKILEKHGDIALYCNIDPKVPLENICKVVQDLESVLLSSLCNHHVNHLKSVLQLGEAVGINVKWLCKRCNDLEKLASHLTQYPTLKSDLAHTKKDIQDKEKLLSSKRTIEANMLPEIKSLEKELEWLKHYKEKLDSALQSIASFSKSFHDKSVVEGLL